MSVSKELVIKLAMALHYADVLTGQMFTSFDELGDVGRESYFKDAMALIEAFPRVGIRPVLEADGV